MPERPKPARIALPRSPSSVATARRFIEARTAAWSFPGPATDQLYRRFRGQRDSYRDVVAAAQAAGEPFVELETTASAAAASGARGYLELLEKADELCRAGVLLTPEPSPQVRALRRWFVDQMAAQVLDGAAPAPPG